MRRAADGGGERDGGAGSGGKSGIGSVGGSMIATVLVVIRYSAFFLAPRR